MADIQENTPQASELDAGQKSRKKGWGIAAKSVIYLVIVGILLYAVSCFVGYQTINKAIIEESQDRAVDIAKLAAKCVDPNKYETYLSTLTESEDYLYSRAQLQNICNEFNCLFIYSQHINDGGESWSYIFNIVNPDSVYSPYPLGYTEPSSNFPDFVKAYEQMLTPGAGPQKFIESVPSTGVLSVAALVPLYTDEGEFAGVMGAEIAVSTINETTKAFMWQMVLFFGVCGALIILFAYLLLRKTLIDPIVRIEGEIRRFVVNKGQPSDALASVKNRDEIGSLAYAITKMEYETADYVSNIARMTSEREMVEAELAMGKSIQESALPDQPFIVPGDRFRLAAQEITAREVGGDFYDFFMLDDNHLAVLIADVSDKGLSAALFMMSAKKALRSALECAPSFDEALVLANRLICEGNKSDMFLTLWVAVIDARTGYGRYANAGHHFPVIRHADGTIETMENDPDLFMGNFPDISPAGHALYMAQGDTLLLFTDGITDAESVTGERFNEEGILEALRVAPAGVRAVEETVMSRAREFSEGMPQFDDMTVLALERVSAEEPACIDLYLPAEDESVEACIDAVEELVSGFGCSDAARRNINTIIDEIVINIVSYAYDEEVCEAAGLPEGELAPGFLRLFAQAGDNYAVLRFEDCGVAFDPLAKKDPDIEGEPQIGGLGIYLCKNLADGIRYERVGDRNVLEVLIVWGV